MAAPAWAEAPSTTRWERLRGADLRVANVAYRLSVANKSLCSGALAPQLGFVVHGIEQYGPADRESAALGLGLGSRPGVMAVIAHSPAGKAGLLAGDQLLAVNGVDLGAGDGAAAAPPTRAFVERAQRILADQMGKGSATLSISRAGAVSDLTFAAEMGCPVSVELVPGQAVNAWADGARIVVSHGILARCATDDDLALVIGHELAHNLLDHSRMPSAAGGAAGLLSLIPGQGSAQVREHEEEADRLAVRLARAADYKLDGAEAFLGGLLEAEAGGSGPSTHPMPFRRLALLRAAIAAQHRSEKWEPVFRLNDAATRILDRARDLGIAPQDLVGKRTS
ncbi:MAG: M48 family metalloprotease [Allosphingosinicella sp.]